jgi:hypothetical protein
MESLVRRSRGIKLRFSAAHLLVAMIAMFIVLPIADELPRGNLIESIIFTLVMIAGINALGGTWRVQVFALVLAIPALFARWIDHFSPGIMPPEASLIVALLFVALMLAHLLRFIGTSPVVNSEVLCSAVAGYLLVAQAWAIVYTLLARWQPGAFLYSEPVDANTSLSGFMALYYSVQVLTTVTFSDVRPASNIARLFSMLEALSGALYMAIVIARLVGVYSSEAHAEETEAKERDRKAEP